METKSPPPCPNTATVRRNPPRGATPTPYSAALSHNLRRLKPLQLYVHSPFTTSSPSTSPINRRFKSLQMNPQILRNLSQMHQFRLQISVILSAFRSKTYWKTLRSPGASIGIRASLCSFESRLSKGVGLRVAAIAAEAVG
ncbi:hypothetical protein R6Q59_007300 [Mikania micrantha]